MGVEGGWVVVEEEEDEEPEEDVLRLEAEVWEEDEVGVLEEAGVWEGGSDELEVVVED